MIGSVDSIIKQAPSFRAYLATGNKHCVIPYDDRCTTSINGVKVVDWIADLVSGKSARASAAPGVCPSRSAPYIVEDVV